MRTRAVRHEVKWWRVSSVSEGKTVQNTAKLALQKAENAKRRRALEEKCRQTECLETVKIMNAAKVRLQVYEQDMDSDEETSEILHPPPASCGWRNLPPIKEFLQCTTWNHSIMPRMINLLWQRKVSQTAIKVSLPARGWHCSTCRSNSINTGQRYKGWEMSFQILIGRKNIPLNKKIYYHRKYVAGQAKKAFESYFLLCTDKD